MPDAVTSVPATTTTRTVPVDGIGPVPVTVTERGHGRPYLVLHGGAGPQSVDGFAALLPFLVIGIARSEPVPLRLAAGTDLFVPGRSLAFEAHHVRRGDERAMPELGPAAHVMLQLAVLRIARPRAGEVDCV